MITEWAAKTVLAIILYNAYLRFFRQSYTKSILAFNGRTLFPTAFPLRRNLEWLSVTTYFPSPATTLPPSEGLGGFPQKSGTPLRQGYPAIHFPLLPPERGQGLRSYLTSFLTFPLPSLTMTTCFVPPGTVSAVVTIPESV